MGTNWLPRSVSFAESIAISPKNLLEPKRLAFLRIDVYHSTRMTATVGVHGGVSQSAEWRRRESDPHKISIRDRNLEEALDHGRHLLRYLELMKVACADGHADVEVRFERK